MKIGKVLAVFFAVCFIAACGNAPAGDATVANNTFDKTATIQGAIFDATTGARISGSDTTVLMVRGTSQIAPNSFITDATNNMVGEYAYNSVPLSSAALGANIMYKMVVIKPGYQRFESQFSLIAAASPLGANTIEANYNFIRNIYLFPLGATAQDIVVYVEFNNKRVPDATVYLQQLNSVTETVPNPSSTSGTVPAAQAGATRLPNTLTGLLPMLSATTDASGIATFAGTDLVLGGSYTPIVLPMTFESVSLARTAGVNIILGTTATPITQLIAMADDESGALASGLNILFTNVSDQGVLKSTGVLTVVFDRPVVLENELEFAATCACTAGACGIPACPATLTTSGAAGSVTAVVSADGYTLTLAPNWTVAPVATDYGLTLSYVGLLGGPNITTVEEPNGVIPLFTGATAPTYLAGILPLDQISGSGVGTGIVLVPMIGDNQ